MMSNFEELFVDETIEDIVISPYRVLYYKQGSWSRWEGMIPRNLDVYSLARTIAEQVDIELGYRHPSADAYWKLSNEHHFRAHVVCPPMINIGPEITLRRIRHTKHYKLDEFEGVKKHKIQLQEAVEESKSILISGATGSGKSSLLCSLMSFMPNNERILILEDSPELPLPNEFSSRLLARQDRFGARNGSSWKMTDLVIESLRMRPDRLILGECRGSEALALCRALQTGHSGVMTTVHAGSTQEAMARISDLCRDQSSSSFDQSSLWDLVVHMEQNIQGKRFITELYDTHSTKSFN